MLAASAGWDGLAAELRSTAASYSSMISGLTTAWVGPSSARMAAAAAPYAAWLNSTAAQAEQTANQARAAVAAYETAFAATVPPPVIAANRAELASLVATNVFGQNTGAIAATEAQYARMWAQDSAAMYGYAAQSATASRMTPFDPPAQNTNPGGSADQAAAVAQTVSNSAGTDTRSALSQLTSATPGALQSLAAPAAVQPSPLSSLASFLSDLDSSPLAKIAGNVELIPKAILPVNDVFISAIMGLVRGVGVLSDGAAAAQSGAVSSLAAGLGSGAPALGSAAGSVSGGIGQAGLVGNLAVPPSWAAATPAIRTVAAVLSGSAEGAVPVVAVSQGSLFGGIAVAGMAGAAIAAAAPRARTGATGKAWGVSADDRTALKDSDSPESLQRLVAEMADKPESVQHWHTDPEHLDGLLDKLRLKPGTHAVHVKNGKPKATLPNSLSR
jgi:PPE-repeat protein